MSYDLDIFLPAPAPDLAAYQAFVDRTLRLRGDWKRSEIQSNLDWKFHEYHLSDRQSIADDDWDMSRTVGVWVSLGRNNDDYPDLDLPPDRFPRVLYTSTGAGRSPLSMLVQLLIPALAFDHFGPGVVVVDPQSDDPANTPRYDRKADYLAHVRRLCQHWHGDDFLRQHPIP